MKEPATMQRIEPRWPVVVAIIAVLIMLEVLPDERIRVFSSRAVYAIGVTVLGPIIAVVLTSARDRWVKIERLITLLFSLMVVVLTTATLSNLISEMVWRSEAISGLQLLTSSIAMWVLNVFAFSLLYWQIDRGGPDARANNANRRPDWLFPQEGAPVEDLPAGWRPTFVDYLFLGFCTATAFSPTDVLPLTSRAKLLMMLESTIALVTMVVVASRAINILGS